MYRLRQSLQEGLSGTLTKLGVSDMYLSAICIEIFTRRKLFSSLCIATDLRAEADLTKSYLQLPFDLLTVER